MLVTKLVFRETPCKCKFMSGTYLIFFVVIVIVLENLFMVKYIRCNVGDFLL